MANDETAFFLSLLPPSAEFDDAKFFEGFYPDGAILATKAGITAGWVESHTVHDTAGLMRQHISAARDDGWLDLAVEEMKSGAALKMQNRRAALQKVSKNLLIQSFEVEMENVTKRVTAPPAQRLR